MTKTAIVCGAGGFIGSTWLTAFRRKDTGYGVDLKENEYGNDKADDFVIGDLRDPRYVNPL